MRIKDPEKKNGNENELRFWLILHLWTDFCKILDKLKSVFVLL